MTQDRITLRLGVEGGDQAKRVLDDVDSSTKKLTKSTEDFVSKLRSADFSAYDSLANKLKRAEFGGSGLRQTANDLKGVQKQMGMTAQQSTQLAYQLNDVAVQLAGGQNPFLIILQQGSQITPLFGGILATLARFAPVLIGIGATAGPAFAALKGASIGKQAAEELTEIGKQAKLAGLSVGELGKYLRALSSTGADEKEVGSSFERLRRAAFSSRDAALKARDEYQKKVSEQSPGEEYKAGTFKLPEDIFRKLGLDMTNFNGRMDDLIKRLQEGFGKIGNGLQKAEFARIVEQEWGKPIADLVQKTPQQVNAINDAFSKIVPPLSQGQVDLAAKVKGETGIISKIYEDFGKQVNASFLPVGDAFNQFKLHLITDKGNMEAFIETAKNLSASMTDFWKILDGDTAAKNRSPWVATFVQTFDSLVRLLTLGKDGLAAFFELGELGFQKIHADLLGLEAIWLRVRKFMAGAFGSEFDSAIAENKRALGVAEVRVQEAERKLAKRGDKIAEDLSSNREKYRGDAGPRRPGAPERVLYADENTLKNKLDESTNSAQGLSKALDDVYKQQERIQEYANKRKELDQSLADKEKEIRDRYKPKKNLTPEQQMQEELRKAADDYYKEVEKVQRGLGGIRAPTGSFVTSNRGMTKSLVQDQQGASPQATQQQAPAEDTKSITRATTQLDGLKKSVAQADVDISNYGIRAIELVGQYIDQVIQKTTAGLDVLKGAMQAAADASKIAPKQNGEKTAPDQSGQALASMQELVNSAQTALQTVQGMSTGIVDTVSTTVNNSVQASLTSITSLIAAMQQAIELGNRLPSAATKPSSGGLPGMASGGLVRGPGTSRSDDVLRWLSNGEFVLNAGAVNAIGVGPLQALNSSLSPTALLGAIPGLADGGLVGNAYSPPGGLEGVRAATIAGGERSLTLVLDGKDYGGLSGPEKVVNDLERHATIRRLSSTTKRSPSRIS